MSYNLLNFYYPSITVGNLSAAGTTTVFRKLKNVGTPRNVHSSGIDGVSVSVSMSPSNLRFDEIGEVFI